MRGPVVVAHSLGRMPSPRPTAEPEPIGLVPLRTGGKSRLGAALAGERRDRLTVAMLDDVLTALRAAEVRDVRLLAGGSGAVRVAAARGLPTIGDPSGTEDASRAGTRPSSDAPAGQGDVRLRAAVDAALASLPDDRPRLVIAADLPRLDPDEVTAVLAHPADVVIAPTAGGGTALLRLATGVRLASQYGPGSAEAHLRSATVAGLEAALLHLPGARQDVDASTDVAALLDRVDGRAPGAATTAFLAELRGYPRQHASR